MTGFIEREVASITEYVSAVLATGRAWQNLEPRTEVWFRGQERRSYELRPSAYRRNWDHESMYHYFKQMAGTLLEPRPRTTWEWYFAAQHFGIPTRLLDWTDDPLVALYFALKGDLPEEKDPVFDANDPPVVWIMDAARLNKIAHDEYYVYVESEHAESWSNNWLPQRINDAAPIIDGHSTASVFAMHPARMTNRIVAQRGAFTVHGRERAPIESIFSPPNDQYLVKIVLHEAKQMLDDVADLGLSRFRLFPECATLAEHIRNLYKPPA